MTMGAHIVGQKCGTSVVVLTEGEFAWDDEPGHSEAAAALPPALHRAYDEEPRWVDLRWLRDVDQVDQSNPRLRECVADLAAAVREVPKDVLVGEHVRQHRRTMRLARGGVTTLAMLVIVAIVAAVVAVIQRQTAQEQQRIAQEQQRIATARQLIAQADVVRGTDQRTALQLAIAAQHIQPGAAIRTSLVNLLLTSSYAGWTVPDLVDTWS